MKKTRITTCIDDVTRMGVDQNVEMSAREEDDWTNKVINYLSVAANAQFWRDKTTSPFWQVDKS